MIFTTIFLFFTTTTLVSFTLRATQERMLKFTYLLQHHISHHLPYATIGEATFTIITPFQYTFSIITTHPFNAPAQYTLSLNPFRHYILINQLLTLITSIYPRSRDPGLHAHHNRHAVLSLPPSPLTYPLSLHTYLLLPLLPVFTHVVETLVFVPIMIGMLFFLFEFFSDQLLAFMVLSLVWFSEVFSGNRHTADSPNPHPYVTFTTPSQNLHKTLTKPSCNLYHQSPCYIPQWCVYAAYLPSASSLGRFSVISVCSTSISFRSLLVSHILR